MQTGYRAEPRAPRDLPGGLGSEFVARHGLV